MKKRAAKIMALMLSASMLMSMTPAYVHAEGAAEPITVGSAGTVQGVPLLRLDFSEKDWVMAITGVSVDGEAYTKSSWISMMPDEQTWNTEESYNYNTGKAVYYLRLTNDKEDTTDFVISAEGYQDVVLHVIKGEDGNYTAQMENPQPAGGEVEEPVEDTKPPITLDQVSLSVTSGRWILSFENADDYVSTITSLTVNDEEWIGQDYDVNVGGKYYKNLEANQLAFIGTQWVAGGHDILKSGDVIKITSSAYEDLTLKFNHNGTSAFISEDDGLGDYYQLNVKLDGDFGSAIKGQTEYDAVSAATGVVSTDSNSNAKVYVAISERDTEPADDAWTELGLNSEIQIDPDKTFVTIVPDTAKGTPEDADSGLEGIYTTLDSSLSLTGAPKDAGDYLVSVTITDTQGRTAVSNTLPLKIHSGEETLEEMLTLDNLTQTSDGKYMWKNMEPWTITEFGSNVEGQENTIKIPEDLKAWYGSSESGLYGNLGYAIPWKEVKGDQIPQTLIIPSGCDLTMVNMEFQSSVKIVVEDGAKLSLRDSVSQGVIDVKAGGTFSMNYNGFGGQGEFLTGANVDGQVILEDGAIIENSAVVSHTNYIANGDVNDRTNADAAILVQGNVTVKGNVYIAGDEAGTDPGVGQTGLLVKSGTLTLEDGANLVVYGGAGKVTLNATGGTAVELENGTITGNGKLVAIGGAVHWGNGGNAVSGTGTISTTESYLQGANASEAQNAKPGKAIDGNITLSSARVHVADGTIFETTAEDPNAGLYWQAGAEATPDTAQYDCPDTPEKPEPEKPSDDPTIVIRPTFDIKTPPISSLKNTTSGVKITWKKLAESEGYYILRKSGKGSWKKIATVTSGNTVTYTDKSKLTNGTTYSYAVRGYKDNGKTKSMYQGKKIVRLTTPKVKSVKNTSKNTLTVKWNKNTKATGYQVRCKTGKTTKTITVKGSKNLTKAIKKLKKNKTYTVDIRSYKTSGGATYYSAWSTAKKAKIKK